MEEFQVAKVKLDGEPALVQLLLPFGHEFLHGLV